MADLEKTVKILFNGDDQISKTISSISSNVSDFGSKMGDIADPWANIADSVLKVDAAMTALAVGGLAYAFTKSMEFESSVIELNKVLGENPEGLRLAKEAALSLSDQYGQSATSILGSTANFKQAGFNIEESMQLTKNAMDLVIVGGVEASEASDLLVRTLKGFDAPASDAARLLDILNETSNNYATGVSELAVGMAELSPIASAMGFSFEETAGILTPVIEVFGSGEEVARGFKTGLQKLTGDIGPVQTALAALGVSQTDVNGQMRTGRDIFYDVQNAFTGLTSSEKTYYSQQLVGIDQSAKMLIAFDGINKVAEVTKTAMNSAGSAAKELAIFLESSEVAVDRFKEGFQNLSIIIGDQFRDAAKGAINGGTEIENALQSMVKDGTFDVIFEKIESFATQLGKNMSEIAKNLPEAFEGVDFGGLLDAFDDLGLELRDALSRVWGDLDLTTPEGLQIAIQKVVDGFTSLINISKGVIDGLGPLFSTIGAGIDQLTTISSEASQMAGAFLGVARDVKFLTDNLDLFKIALLPIAGASMVNAIANIGSLGTAAVSAALNFSGTTGLSTILTKFAGAGVVGLAVTGAATLGYQFGTWLQEKLENSSQSMKDLMDDVRAYATATGNDDLIDNFKKLDTETAAAVGQLSSLNFYLQSLPAETQTDIRAIFLKDGIDAAIEALGNIPEEQETTVYTNAEMTDLVILANAMDTLPEEKRVLVQTLMDAGQFKTAVSMLDDIPEKKDIIVNAETGEAELSIEKFAGMMIETLDDGSLVIVQAETDKPALEKTAKEIKTDLTPLKILEIQTELDVAKLDTVKSIFSDTMSVINTQIEWGAKIDIAQIEADADQAIAAFDSIGDSVVSVTDVVGSMFSDITSLTSSTHFYELFEVMKDEMSIQEKLVDAQIKLIEAQVRKMDSGEAIFTISGENMSDAAMGFMYSIMDQIKIQNHADGGSMLMGTP